MRVIKVVLFILVLAVGAAAPPRLEARPVPEEQYMHWCSTQPPGEFGPCDVEVGLSYKYCDSHVENIWGQSSNYLWLEHTGNFCN